MIIKPILFSTPMVRAIREDRKTKTRRVVTPQPVWEERPGTVLAASGWSWSCKGGGEWKAFPSSEEFAASIRGYAPRQPGDILWVRETFFQHKDTFYYKADNRHLELESHGIRFRWRPSIHMPKDAARLFLRVTDVEAERLQDSFSAPISPIFALRDEGIDIGDTCRQCIDNYGSPCCVDTIDEDGSNLYGKECGILDENRSAFADLWDSLNAKRGHGWYANPWVWVYTFEHCERPAVLRMEDDDESNPDDWKQ